MEITATMVKELREKTGVGMMDCKKALIETNGDINKAIEFLRKKGLSKVASKSDRIAAEGIIGSYVHLGGKIGVLVEVNCETDFVARNEEFQELVKNIAMQIAASKPEFISKEDIPPERLNKEREILMEQPDLANKPENVREKMIEGRMKKFYEELCLLNQPYIKDPSITIEELIAEKVSKLGEKIVVSRFTRYVLGEKS